MSSTAAHQIAFSTRTVGVAIVVFLAAIALAVALPLTLRSTHTVFVKTSGGATSGGTSSTSGVGSDPVQLMRAAHGGGETSSPVELTRAAHGG